VAQLVEALRYKLKVAGLIANVVTGLTYSFQPQYFPGFDLAFNRNDYQG
jgi:hypothetical protein